MTPRCQVRMCTPILCLFPTNWDPFVRVWLDETNASSGLYSVPTAMDAWGVISVLFDQVGYVLIVLLVSRIVVSCYE